MRWSILKAVSVVAVLLAVGPAAADATILPECSDGENNDLGDDGYNDGADYEVDPDCESPLDDRERGPACSDHIDNDGDGVVDYVDNSSDPRYEDRDTDCAALDQDTEGKEPSCSSAVPEACGGASPCADNPTPPMGLQASRESDGVQLTWFEPLQGAPVAYHVYRVEAGGPVPRSPFAVNPIHDQVRVFGTGPDTDAVLARSEPLNRVEPGWPALHAPAASPIHGLSSILGTDSNPDAQLAQAEPLARWTTALPSLVRILDGWNDPLPSPTGGGNPVEQATTPLAAVPGSQTSFLDGDASADGTYVYWVVAAGDGCQSVSSNHVAVDARIPDIADCMYFQSVVPPDWVGPSTGCLNGLPL